jgi:hypothetical protein
MDRSCRIYHQLKVFKAGAVTLFEGFPERKNIFFGLVWMEKPLQLQWLFFSSVFSVVIATYNQSNSPLPSQRKEFDKY